MFSARWIGLKAVLCSGISVVLFIALQVPTYRVLAQATLPRIEALQDGNVTHAHNTIQRWKLGGSVAFLLAGTLNSFLWSKKTPRPFEENGRVATTDVD